MADAVNTEGIKPAIEQATPKSKGERFAKWLRGFRKPNPQATPSPSPEPEKTETQPPKSVNELLGVKEADQLKQSPSLLIHTAPEANLEKLKSQGLFAQKDDPNLGNNLGYSTFFATEHHQRRTGQKINPQEARTAASPAYVLTIWRKNETILKETGDFKRMGFYQPSMEPPAGTNLDEYVNAKISGNKDYEWFVLTARDSITKGARMVPAEYFAAGLKLNQPTRDLIIKNMVLAETGMASADQIQQRFQTVINSEEIAHGLTTSIEHSLLRNSIMEQITEIKTQKVPNPSLAEKSLLQAMLLRTKVNDKVSAVYLDKAIRWLIKNLEEQGVNTQQLVEDNASKINNFNQSPGASKPPVQLLDLEKGPYYYGSDAGTYASMDIKRELGIAT